MTKTSGQLILYRHDEIFFLYQIEMITVKSKQMFIIKLLIAGFEPGSLVSGLKTGSI